MKKLVTIFLLTLVSVSRMCAISYTFTFDISKVSVTDTRDSTNLNSLFLYEDLDLFKQAGFPLLPVKYVSISIPAWADKVNIHTTLGAESTIALPHPIAMSQPAFGEGDSIPRSDIQVKTESVEFISQGFANGICRILNLAIYPLSYDKSTNCVTFYSSIDVSLDFETSDSPTAIPLAPKGGLTADDLDRIKDRVINPSDIEANIANVPTPYTTDQEDYGYLIICPKALYSAFERLACYRRLKGFGSNIFTIEGILNSPQFANGDEISGLNDDAGKLRAFIQYAYQYYGTKYVLLAGKYPTMPVRKIHDIPTDLYFSDLNGSWAIGPFSIDLANLDYEAEVSVGRIPFTTPEEITTYINNIISYELNPDKTPNDYLNRAFMTRQDYSITNTSYNIGPRCFTDDKISHFLSLFNGDNLINYSERDGESFPRGFQVISKMNSTPCGVYNFIGHGNPGSVATCLYERGSDYTVSSGIIADENETAHLVEETGNSLSDLRLKSNPSWHYSMSCDLMPFDGSSPFQSKNYFGEVCLFDPNVACIAFIGNTRSSILGAGQEGLNFFFKEIKELYTDQVILPGIFAGDMLKKYRKYNFPGRCYSEPLMHNLLGDPLVNLWIKAPERLSYTYWMDEESSDYMAAINRSGTEQLYIASIPIEDQTFSGHEILQDNDLNKIVIRPNYVNVIYGKNTYPEILPLRIGGMSFGTNLTYYIFAKDVTCGEHAGIGNLNYSTSTMTFEPNTEVSIESLGNVTLSKGIEFKSGSKLTINAAGTVTLNIGILPVGVTLIINAKEVKGTVLCKSGSTLIINGQQMIALRKNRSNASPAEPVMAVEGRTWWYTGFSGLCTGRQTKHEFGLRIGDKVDLDGETWNAIDLCVSADQTAESLDYHWGDYILHDWVIDRTPRTVAYIRETNGRVVTRINHAPDEYQPLERSFNEWRYSNSSGGASDNIIYDFNCDSDTVRLGPIDMPNRFIKTEVDSITSADKVFYIYEFARMDIDRPTSIHPDLFQASPLTGVIPNPDFGGNIFCAPFEPYARDPTPALRYVTDGENNILYEALGGLKAWETDAFLSISDLLAPEAATSWHNLQGVEISNPAAPGIYIRRQGTTTTKVVIK